MIKIESSYGTIYCNTNGEITDIISDGLSYLNEIERFNIKEWDDSYESKMGKPSPKPSEFDILDLGYWKKDGSYQEPQTDWRNN